jgi:hypothetical protein|nr:hypothetical protein [Oxalobacteraceae bacterium]
MLDTDDAQEPGPNHQFVVMWSCEGLEYVADITEDQHQRVLNRLKGKKHISGVANIMHLQLRAQYNSQRFYEIYVVEATDGITEQDIRDMFESSPQMAADTIRSKGTRVYGTPMGQSRPKIT